MEQEQEQDDSMQGIPMKDKQKPAKEGTSAWAIQQAKAKARAAAAGKKAVNWNDNVQHHHYEGANTLRGKTGDGLDYDEEPGEYTDQWGVAHPYTSEDYKTDPARYDQQAWAPKKGKGGAAEGR
eukprot:2894745-Alexandrium_andersonii.AAC.1